MKNIHVLSTDIFNQLGIDHYGKTPTQIKIAEFLINKNIYITSDEEIKEGDWCLDITGNLIVQCLRTSIDSYWNKNCKKIILTTDQDLIKDGVQAIDDEFLEWFVKNPNCEGVEVKFIKDGWCLKEAKEVSFYKTIIPKEEPKQETLEEYIEKLYPKDDSRYDFTVTSKIRNGIREGAKWQQERMYSEEEVYNILIHHTVELFKREPITLEDFWNKFKNK